MNQTLKLNQKDQDIFFWGCSHIFHNPNWPVPIWKSRGYNSVEEHTEGLREKINKVCSKDSLLFLLGDGWLNSSVEQVDQFLDTLNPSVAYIWGNHESSTSKIYRREVDNYLSRNNLYPNIEIYPFKYKNITFCGNYLELEVRMLSGRKTNFVLSHFPFKVFNNAKRGWAHLHSHNHGTLPSSLPAAQEGKILETSVDVFPDGPVSLDRVVEILDKKQHKTFDAHH